MVLALPAVVDREVGSADLGIRGRSRERRSFVMLSEHEAF